jgi:NAD(P)-dependent dehydrogenase (short-subunit alcohol dehydrogenase family)
MMSLEGKTVVVTGAGKGIGRATAVLAAQRGARVIAIARTEQDLKELAEQIGSRSIVADISDAAIALKAAESSMPADHLVNCAGTNIHESFLHTKVESFDAIQALNVRATLIFSQVFARHRIAQGGGGAIVNVSSIAAWNGFTNHASYSASKGAVDGLTRVMANELGEHGIRVNAVNPGITLTALAALAWDDPVKSGPMMSRTPRGKFGTPEEVAEVILFLLSDAAVMVNGITMPIDGGFMAT